VGRAGAGPESIRFPLLLTVLFGRHLPPERLERFLERHRSVHAERLEGYERQHRAAVAAGARDLEPYALTTLEFGIAYERALLDWFDHLPPRLRPSAQPAGPPEPARDVADGASHRSGSDPGRSDPGDPPGPAGAGKRSP
jgi:hypothetical protein